MREVACRSEERTRSQDSDYQQVPIKSLHHDECVSLIGKDRLKNLVQYFPGTITHIERSSRDTWI